MEGTMRGKLLLAVLAVVALVIASSRVEAQTDTGRISGAVTDPQGGVMPGVSVTATNVTNGFARTTATDAKGTFVIANLPPAAYEVSYELAGFKQVKNRLTVPAGGEIAADAKLELGAVTEQVNVTATVETVNVRTPQFQTTITTQQIAELPTLTRNPYDLVAVAGNVQSSPTEETDLAGVPRGVGFSINGGRSADVNILLDGGDNNNVFDTSVGQQIPLDAVQEFSVITNNYSAQFGRAAGGIINVVTKSGSNTLNGTAYEFFRNEKLATNTPDNEANGIEKGQFHRNQLGYSVGGPIKKDKIHFFSSLEYIGVRSTDTLISWIPTPQFLAASAGTTQAYFNAYGKGVTVNGPVLTRSQVSGIVGAGAGAFNNLPADLPVFGRVDQPLSIDAGGGDPQNTYLAVEKVDFSAGANSQASIRYALRNRKSEPGTQSFSPYALYNTNYTDHDHNLNASLTRVWSLNFTTQSKVVWNQLDNEQPVNGPVEPRLMMNPTGPVRLQGYRIAFPGYLPFNPGNDIPAGGPQKLLQFYQDQTWLKGNHDIRFGGSFVHINDDHTFSAYNNAVEFLNTTNNALTSLNDFVFGSVLRYQKAINPNGYPGGTFTTPVNAPSFTSFNRYNEYALYAQDNWRLSSRLTANLGVRYEYYGPQQKSDPKYDSNFYYADANLNINTASPQQIIDSVRGGTVFPSNTSPVGGLWKSDNNNFAPRVGLAWDVNGDGKQAVRGGYGISYNRNFGNVTYNVLFNPPLYLVSTIDSPNDVAFQPVYTDNNGPFAGSGVTKPIPPGSLRHIDQNIKNEYVHLYGVSWTKEVRTGVTGSVEYNGSSGRNLYDLADINKVGAAYVYEGIGSPNQRPNPLYGAFNTRGNRGKSQYNGVVFSLEGRNIKSTGLTLTSHYTLSKAKDNLSATFSDGDNNGFFNTGYLDAYNPMLDYGNSGFDVRHRVAISAIWNIPYGGKSTLAGGWLVNAIVTARSGYPFSVFDCTNGGNYCMRAVDPGNINKDATGGPATGNPNEFTLLDLSPLLGSAGSYFNPLTGNSDFGPYPANMTARNAFRGPGYWNVDFVAGKRFYFAGNRAVMARLEVYDLFNHHNMYAHTDAADVSGATSVTGYLKDNRRMQLGFKFEF